MSLLPLPEPGNEVGWVREHLASLTVDEPRAPSIQGGQSAANEALSAFNVTGYAERRNEVWPPDRRGASRLSPYIRHGLLSLPRVWRDVAGPAEDVAKFRDELLWQEYARHLYARVGSTSQRSLRFRVADRTAAVSAEEAWPRHMACLSQAVDELRDDGWLPNQTRMWLASHWAVRQGRGWRDGEDFMFAYLLDGSRAANRLGWQWTAGALTGTPYGFSREQVKRQAPGLCEGCGLRAQCPIETWPTTSETEPLAAVDPRLRNGSIDRDPLARSGEADQVWITAESLGDADPALEGDPALSAVFVWDAPLLSRLRLSSTRLVFLAECLADLGTRRQLEVRFGDPVAELAGRRLATTRAPVPGWHARAHRLRPAVIRPWDWLVPPHDGPVSSFTAWRRRARV